MEAAGAGPMRIGVGHVPEVTDEVATFAHQLGAPYVLIWPKYADGRFHGLRGRAHAIGYLQALLRATAPATPDPAAAA